MVPEREKQAFVTSLASRTSRNISLHTLHAPDDPAALHLAVSTILQRKGRVQDAVSTNLSALRQRFGADDQKLLDQWSQLTSKLAKLVLHGPEKMTAAEYAKQISALENQRDTLEAQMNRRSAGFYPLSKPATLSAIQAAIPENAALIEFGVYRPFDPKAPDNQKAYGVPRYVAYVVRGQGEVQWKDLGETHLIDQAIGRWRKASRDPQRKDVKQLARALDEKIMRPIRGLTGDATHLLVSPDGELNLIPFEALLDEQGRYVARALFHHLSDHRTRPAAHAGAARKQECSAPRRRSLFRRAGGTLIPEAGRTNGKPATSITARRSITTGEDLSTVYFAPLGGTAAGSPHD